ncbi:hypothetical protein [Gillisia sp. Hel_I_29]|uniref:hypothetical protein n=1 Tax=Gillisia sp. Hel_I_29 TaxID=1249975 RepID=UPI00054D3157|nr:hypothetical protein [Gillisia sp. Hel_I_29]|tara:strand:+ start:10195 stop:10410 length:216 start_codon:yes stop_codon:yes gene_type:complete
MKKVFFIITVALTTLFASCKEPKTEAPSPDVLENVNNENKTERLENQDSIQMARKMKMDSIEQVKSHGHAH